MALARMIPYQWTASGPMRMAMGSITRRMIPGPTQSGRRAWMGGLVTPSWRAYGPHRRQTEETGIVLMRADPTRREATAPAAELELVDVD